MVQTKQLFLELIIELIGIHLPVRVCCPRIGTPQICKQHQSPPHSTHKAATECCRKRAATAWAARSI